MQIKFRQTTRADVTAFYETLGNDAQSAKNQGLAILQQIRSIFEGSDGLPELSIPDAESKATYWIVLNPFLQFAFVVVEPKPERSWLKRVFQSFRKPAGIKTIKIVDWLWQPRPVAE